MNYLQQAAKENPFANLSPSEAKKMFVYLNMISTPRMSDSEIYRRYGFMLPNGSMGLNIAERTMLAIEVTQEMAGQRSGKDESEQDVPSAPTKPSNSGCLIPIILGLSSLICCLVAIA